MVSGRAGINSCKANEGIVAPRAASEHHANVSQGRLLTYSVPFGVNLAQKNNMSVSNPAVADEMTSINPLSLFCPNIGAIAPITNVIKTCMATNATR